MLKNSISFLLLMSAGIAFAHAQKSSSFDVSSLSEDNRQAYRQLVKAERFGIGATGYAGETTDGEDSLRILLKSRKSVKALESLAGVASPEGRLYALVGLRLKNKRAYRRALLSLKNFEPPERYSPLGILTFDDSFTINIESIGKGIVPKGEVVTDIGGLIRIKKWTEIVSIISAGGYNKLLKKAN